MTETETSTEVVQVLERLNGELRDISRVTEREMEGVANTFRNLAAQVDAILNLAAEIVGSVDNEEVNSVSPKVKHLGEIAQVSIGDRLQATNGILDTATAEVQLLRRLSQVTRGQAGIALETKALSVLTNIEVARLGVIGEGFQYLARELSEFSKSVASDTQELASLADGRKAAIEETRRALAAEIPRLREELGRIEGALANALSLVESNLAQLSRLPAEFRTGVQEVAQQIAGVVSAVQAQDITRQQIEHVQTGFTIIAERIGDAESSKSDRVEPLAQAYAGLSIQVYQLKAIRETIANWTSQIRTSTEGMLQVSAAGVLGIGARVLDQERDLSSHFAWIEKLEHDSRSYSEGIERTFGGLANLSRHVNEHLERSRSVRDHLQLLTFNSIIEANGLGTRAAAILAIAQSIKGISADWSQITDQSGNVMLEVLKLEKQASGAMEAFSDGSTAKLREAQVHTTSCLGQLRSAAAMAGERAQQMKAATERMQASAAALTQTVDALDRCFGRIDLVVDEVEAMRRQLELEDQHVKTGYNEAEMERLFSASYTTEIERDIIRAALRGTELPVAQRSLAGNSVELF